MRLWHENLIPFLPNQQLLGQHRECCALRGNGWMRKHSTVNYVFNYSPMRLYMYHMLITKEMRSRGYKPNVIWEDCLYRGTSCSPYLDSEKCNINGHIYKEHDDNYLNECIENLASKGIVIDMDELKE